MPRPNKELQREYQLFWMQKRRHLWFLANGPCRHCGSWDDLELDHVDPSQKTDHKVWSWSPERQKVELAKCQALCRTCHIAKSAAERTKPLVHGTDNGYRKRGCHCEVCRAGNAQRQGERARRRAERRRAA